MMTGSAIACPWEAENIPAIINTWYGGQAAGTALADVLFGDYNPSGKLPVTFYKSDNDLPEFSDYSMARRTYRYFTGTPLYGFGHGLSYTTFAYTGLQLPAVVEKGRNVMVSVTVKNTGTMDGEEVVQLYVSSHVKPAPVRSLKGFQRIFLKVNESREIKFVLTPGDLSMAGNNGIVKQLTGKLTIAVGGAQPDNKTLAARETVQKVIQVK
jgi:beta-glucosidase